MAESLSAMLRVQERLGALHGVTVARNVPAISHLFSQMIAFSFSGLIILRQEL